MNNEKKIKIKISYKTKQSKAKQSKAKHDKNLLFFSFSFLSLLPSTFERLHFFWKVSGDQPS